MALGLDPEIAEVLAPMAGAMADATPPAAGDIAARRLSVRIGRLLTGPNPVDSHHVRHPLLASKGS